LLEAACFIAGAVDAAFGAACAAPTFAAAMRIPPFFVLNSLSRQSPKNLHGIYE